MLAGSVGMLLLGTALSGAAQPASTCLFVPLLPHQLDTALHGGDASAPNTPVVVAVDTFRRNGMTCTRASCVANSCGDTGTVRIDLAPSADDATPPEELGYRLLVVRGEVPESMRSSIGVTLAASQRLFLRPSFEELPALDLELAAVAVDAAGNESAPTAPFAVRFDGCTLAAVGDRCEDELDPDTDLSSLWAGGGAEPDPSEPDPSIDGATAEVAAGVSCSLEARGPSSAHPSIARAAVALFGLLSFAARRARRGGPASSRRG
jgi:hypothetical protein